MSKYALRINYSAGRAGIGWKADTPRNVRVPFEGLEAALSSLDLILSGDHPSFPILPDSAWVEEFPGDFPGHTKIHRAYRRNAGEGASTSWSES